MSETNTTILDLDAFMDQDMGSVETLPDYVTPAPGQYMLRVKEAKIKEAKKPKDGEKAKPPRIAITYEIMETISISGDEPPFPNGSLFSDGFQATEDGLKYFKRAAMGLLNVADMTGAKLRDIFDTLEGTEIKAIITQSMTETDGKKYVNINVRPVHETAPV